MKKLIIFILISVAFFVAGFWYSDNAIGAPQSQRFRNILPTQDNTYTIGTSSPSLRWSRGFFTNLDIFATATTTNLQVTGVATSTFQGDVRVKGGVRIEDYLIADVSFSAGAVSLSGDLNMNSNDILNVGQITGTPIFPDGFISQASSTFIADTHFPSGIWESTGNVGIGTTTPGDALVVESATASSSAGSFAGNQLDLFNPTGGYGQAAGIGLHTDEEWSVHLRTVQEDNWLELTDATGNVQHSWSGKKYYPGATSNAGNNTGYISGDGTNVGIGTTTPTDKLEIVIPNSNYGGLTISTNNQYASPEVTLDRNSNLRREGLYLKTNGVDDWFVGMPYAAGQPSSNFSIGTGVNLTDAKFLIDTDGNVGIGTDSPGALLELESSGTTEFLMTGANAFVNHDIQSEYNIQYSRTTGIPIMDFQAFPLDGTSAAQYRFGLTSGSTGANSIILFDSNGATVKHNIGTGSVTFNANEEDNDFKIGASGIDAAFFVQGSDGSVGIGATTPTDKLEIVIPNSNYGGLTISTTNQYASPEVTLDRNSNLRREGLYLKTNGVDDWFVGMPYAAGQPSSNFSIGTGINLTDAKFLIDAAGQVGIGTLNPGGVLDVDLDDNQAEDGAVCITAGNVLSDETDGSCDASALRFKEDISTLTYGLDEVLQLEPKFYRYKEDFKGDFTLLRAGFVAEDVASVIPEAAEYEDYKDGEGVGLIENYDVRSVVAAQTNAIKELEARIAELERLVKEKNLCELPY